MMRKRKNVELIGSPLDPLWGYSEMMSAKDIAEFAGISEASALKWIQENGGVIVVKGKVRNVWRIYKEYVRRSFKLAEVTA